MTSPENLATTYTYNDAGRLTAIANYLGSFGLSYDNAGRRTALTYPNGASAAYTYDANGNLTRVRQLDSGGSAFSDVNYTYNSLNNRSVRTDTQGSASYTYDAVSRLTVNTQGENYSYDGVGNRLTGPLTTDAMTYDAGNEQLSINSILFTYDLNGNRTQKTDGGTVTTYTYDDENRLVQVTVGSDTITYAYDPFGRRIARTINSVTTSYVYDQSAILAAYDGSGNVTARYTHGLNIDEPLAVQQGTVNYFHHADGLGSIVALTNASGIAVQTYSYDSYGNTTISDGISQPYAYTAREYDTETGLYFYRARYYDPKAGRFISRDPIGFGGGDVNLYNYVQNNPVNWIDPWGLQADTIPWPVIIPARLLPVLAPALVNPVTIAIGAGLVVGGQKNSQAMMRSMILVPAGSGSQTNLTVKNKAEKLAKRNVRSEIGRIAILHLSLRSIHQVEKTDE